MGQSNSHLYQREGGLMGEESFASPHANRQRQRSSSSPSTATRVGRKSRSHHSTGHHHHSGTLPSGSEEEGNGSSNHTSTTTRTPPKIKTPINASSRTPSRLLPSSYLTPSSPTPTWPQDRITHAIQHHQLAPCYPSIPYDTDEQPHLYSCNICFGVYEGALNRCETCHQYVCTECLCQLLSFDEWKRNHERLPTVTRKRVSSWVGTAASSAVSVGKRVGSVVVSTGNTVMNSASVTGSASSSRRRRSRRRSSRRRSASSAAGTGSRHSAPSSSSGRHGKCPYCSVQQWVLRVVPRSEEETEAMHQEYLRVQQLQEEHRLREQQEQEKKFQERVESGELERLEKQREQEKRERDERRERRRTRRRQRQQQQRSSMFSLETDNSTIRDRLPEELRSIIPQEMLSANNWDAIEKFLTERAIRQSLQESEAARAEEAHGSPSTISSHSDNSPQTRPYHSTRIQQQFNIFNPTFIMSNDGDSSRGTIEEDNNHSSIFSSSSPRTFGENPFDSRNNGHRHEDETEESPSSPVVSHQHRAQESSSHENPSAADYDEELQLALALSLSLHETQESGTEQTSTTDIESNQMQEPEEQHASTTHQENENTATPFVVQTLSEMVISSHNSSQEEVCETDPQEAIDGASSSSEHEKEISLFVSSLVEAAIEKTAEE